MEHTISPKRRKRNNAGIIAGIVAVGLVVVLLAFIVSPGLREAVRPAAPVYWPTEGWQTALPETQGIDSAKLADALLAWREGGVPIHSLLLIRNGYVVADATFYPYDGQAVHDMASVTKSVMTTLIGIAAYQGKLDLDDSMVSFFPDRAIANRDARKEAITVRHLVSMSSGLQCIRDGMDNDTVHEMHASPDFVQFALDRPMAGEPGRQFIYCSPSIHLLSPILQQATGMTTMEFARQNLFEPLGIRDATWERDPQGHYAGWGDLALHPQDMAKIGYLFLHGGQWEGEQIVSRKWVEEATAVQVTSPIDDPYGYGWWLSPDMEGVFRADGRGGQYIIVLPEWDMIVVTTGGGFDIEQIGESLLATFSDMEGPLPPNPEGVARLETVIAGVAQPPIAQPVPPLPDVARAISGKTFVFESNPIGLTSAVFEFDGSAEATGQLMAGNDQLIPMVAGLDGVYRFSTMPDDEGRLVGFRGNWSDPQTFMLEYNGVLSNDQMVLRFHFQDDQVVVTVGETASMPGVEFEGRLQEP